MAQQETSTTTTTTTTHHHTQVTATATAGLGLASMLYHVNSYQNFRTGSAATRTPPSKATNIPSGWVSISDAIDEISKGCVLGYQPSEQDVSCFQREEGEVTELINFGSHYLYRFLCLQCDQATLIAYLRRPVVFTLWDTVYGLAHKLCRLLVSLYPVSPAHGDCWGEKTAFVFEQSKNPPPGLSPFYAKGIGSRFDKVRDVSGDIFGGVFPETETFELTLGQKLLFLLAMFVPRGNPKGFLSMLQLHSKADTPVDNFSPHLHWFVLLLHSEDRGRMTRLYIPDWRLALPYEKSKYPAQLLRAFEPFFDASMLIHRTTSSTLRLEHVMLLTMILPLRLGESFGVHNPSDTIVLMRSGCKILSSALGMGTNVFEAITQGTQQPWFLDFDVHKAQFLSGWMEGMEELARWFTEAQWKLKSGRCGIDDLIARMRRVAPESFLHTLREIFRLLPLLNPVAARDAFDGCDDEDALSQIDIRKAQAEFETLSFATGLTRVRMEAQRAIQSMLMGKRIPDRAIQSGLEVAFKAKESTWNTFGKTCFILENATVCNLRDAERDYQQRFLAPLRERKVLESDSEGTPVEAVSSAEFLRDQPVCAFDLFDKTSNSYSTLVYADMHRFYLFYAWQWAQYYSSGIPKVFIWSAEHKVRQAFFLLSLLRYDMLTLETRKVKDNTRFDSYVPYIHSRISPHCTAATSFDCLYLWIPKALGIAEACTISADRCAAAVHIARFFYSARAQSVHNTALESCFCIRNAIELRKSPRSIQVAATAVFFMGLSHPGVHFALTLRAPIIEFFSTLLEGPRLEWTREQQTQIDAGKAALANKSVPAAKIFCTDSPGDRRDLLVLTEAQVTKLCDWFECKTESGSGYQGAVYDKKKKRPMFWAVYIHLNVSLPCSQDQFSRVFGHAACLKTETRVYEENGDALVGKRWPAGRPEISERYDKLEFAWPALRKARQTEPPGAESPAYVAFFLAMCGSDLPIYFEENDNWLPQVFGQETYWAWRRGALAAAPVVQHSESAVFKQIPLAKIPAGESIHPLFESMAVSNAAEFKDLSKRESAIKFITQMCQSRSSSSCGSSSPAMLSNSEPMLYLPSPPPPPPRQPQAKRLMPSTLEQASKRIKPGIWC